VIERSDRLVEVMEQELERERLPGQRVVVLALPEPPFAMYAPMLMAARGMPKPRAWWTLTLSPEPHVLTRTGPDEFELALTRSHFLANEFAWLFRGPAWPLREGAEVDLEGMRVTVRATNAEGPTRLGFTFDTPLEDPSLVLLHWRDGALRRFTPPVVGARVEL
jgi:hypothetical protein